MNLLRTGATGDAPKVVILVLNWNGREDTIGCLESLRTVEFPNWEVVVVDNGSQDGSVAAIQEHFPEVLVIEVGKNLGFTGGNNLGITAALRRHAEFILMLNNDTIVAPDLLRAFVKAAEENPDAGVFGAKIYFLDEPKHLYYAGGRWNSRGTDLENIGRGVPDNGVDFEKLHDTEFAHGCAMFFRSSTVNTVGLLDDRFFIMYEEMDWCFRARKSGFRCLFVPKAKVWHRVSATFAGRKWSLYHYFMLRNRLLWSERHLTLRRRLSVWASTLETICPVGGVVGVLLQFLHGKCGAKRAYWEIRNRVRTWVDDLRDPTMRRIKKAQLRALGDYVLRRFGDCPASLRAAAADAARSGDS